jgi:hypothetical protein
LGQEPIEQKRASDQSQNRANDESLQGRKRPFFRRRYLVNENGPFILLFFAAVCGGGMIPSSPPYRIYCFWGFIWFLAGAGLLWVAHSQANRHVPADEEIDERFRQDTNKSLGSLNNDIGGLQKIVEEQGKKIAELEPRRLTQEQKNEITKAIAPFRGQPIIIKSLMGAPDGAGFATDFALLFYAA